MSNTGHSELDIGEDDGILRQNDAFNGIEERIVPNPHRQPSETHRIRWQERPFWFLIYIIVLHGIGAAIISGGINFAAAYGMYHHTNRSVRLFRLPNTLAGDTAVTIFVQLVVTWLIESLLIIIDVKNNFSYTVPDRYLYIPNRHGRALFLWYFDLKHTTVAPLFRKVLGVHLQHQPQLQVSRFEKFKDFMYRTGVWFWRNAVRALIFSVPVFLISWPIGVGALAGVGDHRNGDYYFNRYPAPQIYKLAFGAALGLATTPIIALYHVFRYSYLRKANRDRLTNGSSSI